MAVRQVLFHRLAAGEYRSARDWYHERSATVAQRFQFAVDRAVNRLVVDAGALPCLAGPYRYVRIAGFPYMLVFRELDAEVVMVLAVAHTSRRSGYWRGRKP
jgi:plasmid stabilization system protein ParE